MKSHRGLSSVVGAVFLIAIVLGALSYLTYSLEIMGNFSESLIAEESRLKEKQREAFEVTFVNVTAANKLDATIKNTGQIPVKINTLWIDEQGVNDVVQKIAIGKAIAPGNSFNFLTEGIDVDALSTKGYSMKLVSSRGEVQTFYVNSASQESLDIQIVAAPDRIPTAFTSTLLMTVVNNMTGNNALVNLTPNLPLDCVANPDCDLLEGPLPASYPSLDPGDVAIFRWSYQMSGDADDTFSFTGSLQNGVPGNSDTEIVTIGNILEAKKAGESISSVGIGTQEFAPNVFILHTETDGIPSGADYQMGLSSPDTTGTNILFDDTSDIKKWFSANATANDVTIPAGNWDASLRYNHPRLPSGMAAGASVIYDTSTNGGGHTLHFNTDFTTARLDSGTISTCTSLVDSGSLSGAAWSATAGVNGSGAYSFDGNDYISITTSQTKKSCNWADTLSLSIAGWFNGTTTASNDVQTIFSKTGTTEGGYEVVLGDGTADSKGHVIFTFTDKDAASVVCESTGTDYLDDEWHHFVGVYTAGTGCELYVDGVSKVTTLGSVGHEHEKINPHYIGMQSGTTNGFTGVIDDIMFWIGYPLTASDVTALYGYSFGANVTRMNFFISNATGNGNTVAPVLNTDLSYGLPWGDPMVGTESVGWYGANYTASLPETYLQMAYENRLNFTMSYASGEPLTLRIDESELNSGQMQQSSYLQVPTTPDQLPTYLYHDNDNKVSLFIYNAGAEGAWLTYQGTRVVFNGTNGNYAGLIYQVDNKVDPAVTLSASQDGPFIPTTTQADVTFWHPTSSPKAGNPSDPDKIIPGEYRVFIYLNGYDETGAIIVRSIDLGNVNVVE